MRRGVELSLGGERYTWIGTTIGECLGYISSEHSARIMNVCANLDLDCVDAVDREFYGSEAMRTCNACGEVLPADPRFVDAD